MSSRDYGFLTLRNTTAYQQNGLPVPPNYIYTTSTNGAAIFSSTLNISSISTNTLTASTINSININAVNISTNAINVSSIQSNTLTASTINVSSVTANSVVIQSTLTVSSISSTKVINSLTVQAGSNDIYGSGGYMSEFIRSSSTSAYTVDYQITNNPVTFGSGVWQDARYVFNTDTVTDFKQVWGIATSSNTTAFGQNIGDITFYNNVAIQQTISSSNTNTGNLIVDNNATIGGKLTVAYPDNYQTPYELDVRGITHISSIGGGTVVYNTPGLYTTKIPDGVTSISFEMIGAGGAGQTPYYTTGGTGGYINGTINVTPGDIITIKVGQVGSDNTIPSGASYISKAGVDLYVIAGAGGAYGSNYNINSGNFYSIQGGAGGGGSWTNIGGNDYVSNGSGGAQASSTNPPISVGTGGSGGTSTGGAGGTGDGFPPTIPGTSGNNPSGFTDVPGGSDGTTAAGGNGFAGGGSSGGGSFQTNNGYEVLNTGGGGGGSSYYNSGFTTITTSYIGSSVPLNVLTGYGRSGQSGYVAITIINNSALIVKGDVSIAGSLISRVSASTIPSDPTDNLTNWLPYLGKYCFVNGSVVGTLNLPITNPPPEGTMLVIRNTSGVATITINNLADSTGTPVLTNKTASFIYTSVVGPGWYGL